MGIKKYLLIIKQYEDNQKGYDFFAKYFIDKKSTLTNSICEGEAYLPSFMLLKKLKTKYEDLCEIDDELSRLFDSSIQCSKLFYSQIIKLIEKDTKINIIKFEQKFEKNLQPIGQQLVNLLANIKYRIKIVRLKKARSEQKNKKIFSYFLFCLLNTIMNFFSNGAYKLTLLASTNHNMVRKTYYALIFSTIIGFWICNFLFFHNISRISSAFINVISGISIVLFAIMSYPIGDFGKKDISGRNIVAYKYKVLLNHKKNSKLVKIFTLQHGNDIKFANVSSILQD